MKQTEAPFRHRHDGWTPARQLAFLTALRETGCLASACSYVGLTKTSAYRVKKRIPAFSEAWDLALEYRAPALERAAYERAVTGWLEPIVWKGEVVAHRRRYSDAMLRLLMGREAGRTGSIERHRASEEETDAALHKSLNALARRRRAEEVAMAERLMAEGKAP